MQLIVQGDDLKMAKMTPQFLVIKPSAIADDLRCN